MATRYPHAPPSTFRWGQFANSRRDVGVRVGGKQGAAGPRANVGRRTRGPRAHRRARCTPQGRGRCLGARPPQGQPREPPARQRPPQVQPREPLARQRPLRVASWVAWTLSGAGAGGRSGGQAPGRATQRPACLSQSRGRGREASGLRNAVSRKHRRRKSMEVEFEGVCARGARARGEASSPGVRGDGPCQRRVFREQMKI